METLTNEEKKKITELANELAKKTYDFMLKNRSDQKEFSDASIMVCAAIGIIFTLGTIAHGKDKSEQERFIQFVSDCLRTNFEKFNQI